MGNGRNHSKTIIEHKKKVEKCSYCESPFSGLSEKTVDHFIPVSKGGRNSDENKIMVCQPCNNLKADYLPNEFFYIIACQIRKGKGISGFTVDRLKIIYKNIKTFIRSDVGEYTEPGKEVLPRLPYTLLPVLKQLPVKSDTEPRRESIYPDTLLEPTPKKNLQPKWSTPPPIDPVSWRMYKSRIGRQAIEEAAQGYILDTNSVHVNFHIAE